MTHDELRLECLRLARGEMPSSSDHQAIIQRARDFAVFVLDQCEPPPVQAHSANPESKSDPHNPNIPGHGPSGYVSPPTT